MPKVVDFLIFPSVAGIISLLNDCLISKGKPPLGFLNPWLYGEGLAGFNDITSGSNPGCGTNGFSATIVGWDPLRFSRHSSSFSTLVDSGLYRSQVSGHLPDFERLQEIINNRLGIRTSNTAA
ncbi:hypothetical protein EI94DRAFT_550944 [Lactarius quietus]|nr:hypothetical protein EI94DRAFT_550944 [Lactarius quietus]